MKIFDINGADIRFDEKRDNYNFIRKEFLNYAKQASKQFEDYCDANLVALKDINQDYLDLVNELADGGIRKGLEILISYDVLIVDFVTFKDEYCKKYFDFKKIFNNLLVDKKGSKSNKKNSSKLFDIKPVVDKLSRCIYRDCFSIHRAVIDALLKNGIKNVESYITVESIKEANALFNNYKDGFISKPDTPNIVQKMIMSNPYREEMYQFLIQEDGDFSKEIERLTDYLGFDIRPYKTYLMDNYVDELIKNNTRDLEVAKEKIIKYAKYIGYENGDLYITRIDAIYTFEKA